MLKVQQLFPSGDGNQQEQKQLIEQIGNLIKGIDSLKNPESPILGTISDKKEENYTEMMQNSEVPLKGIEINGVIDMLVTLSNGHPYQTKNYVTNAIPMASTPALLGSLTANLLNSNSLWDVYGPAAAEAEVKINAMMAKIVGYDETRSFGYTTWGGQGAVFASLRVAIARQCPNAKEVGIPSNLYCFASENAHYSLLKSVEATGMGSNHLVTIKADPTTHAMDVLDLQEKMRTVIESGGIPIYIAATTGATDSFGIDNVKEIKEAADRITEEYVLNPVYIHADSAMGGFYAMFNMYDFHNNPLEFEESVKDGLQKIREKMQYLYLADSVCFDFHKLGQTAYIASLFLLKDGVELGLLDLEEFETPYVGNRGYGSYHTSYTLECSRMGSAISIYASLLAFGLEGYQQLLANYVRVNVLFREKLITAFPNVAVTNGNNPGPATGFRFYEQEQQWSKECCGEATVAEIRSTNEWNNRLFEQLGIKRDQVFFGDTTRHCLVKAVDSTERHPISVVKFFSISPYTTIDSLDNMIYFLGEQMNSVHQQVNYIVS